jgi:IS5 family transposase
MYHNDTEVGGRPNFDEIIMIKTLFLQGMYNLSDEATEKELLDRISFRNFLHYPDKVPDARTIWLFRERLSESGMDKTIWKAIMNRFKAKGISVKEGIIQDATFMTSDPGHGKHKKDEVIPMDLLLIDPNQNPISGKKE